MLFGYFLYAAIVNLAVGCLSDVFLIGLVILIVWTRSVQIVLVWSVEVGVCPPEFKKLITSEHLLNLFMIDFIQSAKFILLEPKRSWSFKVSKSIILKWILLWIILRRLILVGLQIVHLVHILIVFLVQRRLNLFYYLMVSIVWQIWSMIDAVELPLLAVRFRISEVFLLSERACFAFGHLLWDWKLSLDMKQSFELCELSLEAHVGENDWSLFRCKSKGVFKAHFSFLHEIRNNASGRPGHSSIAMHEYAAAFCHSIFDKSNSGREMPEEALVRAIKHVDDFVS